jgi:hypothetical protein
MILVIPDAIRKLYSASGLSFRRGILEKSKENIAMAASEQKLLPEDILSGILAVASKQVNNSRLPFKGHDSKLQQVFLRLKNQTKADLLNAFVFSDSGPIPYSPALNEAVSKLQLAGMIGRENPNYEVLFLRPSTVNYFDSVLDKRLDVNQKKELELLASEFLKLIDLAG